MSIRFNSDLLMQDLETTRKRRRLTTYKMSQRIDISHSTISGLQSGRIKDITVTTLARILRFMGNTDIEKYIYDDGV